MDKECKDLIAKARTFFLLNEPFLGDLALNLVIKEVGEDITPTMGTDAKHLFYNPEFVKKIDMDYMKAVIAHEIAHCIYGHAGISGAKKVNEKGRMAPIWSAACEYAANHFVVDLCHMPLPQSGMYDRKYSDGSWTTETIYHDLMKKNHKDPDKFAKGMKLMDDHGTWGKSAGQNGEDSDSMTGDPDKDWKIWVGKALHTAKMMGNLPAGVQRELMGMLDPQIPWQHILANYLVRVTKDDYTWRRLNKRTLSMGYCTPSLHSTTFKIGYAVDTSGSMGQKELAEALSEIQSICNSFESYQLVLFACDADVHHVQEVETGDEIDFAGLMKGGGGTDFRPVFDLIQKEDYELDALIYFTDTYGSFPDSPPTDYEVLWLVKGHGETPWGEHIQYEDFE